MRRDATGGSKAQKPAREALRPALLYVEDDDDNWEVADLRLGRKYELIRAATDEQACRIVRERHPALAAILMDIELRGSELNGVELTELFRGNPLSGRALPHYARNLPAFTRPVIYVTAHGVRYSDVQLMLTGADRVVSKPVDFAALNAVLDELTQGQRNG